MRKRLHLEELSISPSLMDEGKYILQVFTIGSSASPQVVYLNKKDLLSIMVYLREELKPALVETKELT